MKFFFGDRDRRPKNRRNSLCLVHFEATTTKLYEPPFKMLLITGISTEVHKVIVFTKN